MPDFLETLSSIADAVNEQMAALLPSGDAPEARLFEAMRYASLGPGKRLRPFFVVTTSRMFEVADPGSFRVAAAVEFVHAYSLIHDDLPAMDDDDLRRGRPTVHRAFDEATAILAGDALLPLAFEILADEKTHADSGVRAQLVMSLAKALGAGGMVGGQVLDLSPPDGVTYGDVARMERMKTGALFRFSCEAGAIMGQVPLRERAALQAYALDMGLAFQIADDLLDLEGDEETVGKKVGKDAEAGKITAISVLGVEQARAKAYALLDLALGHLAGFGEKAGLLRDAAAFAVERRV